jgi:hypothetical protein
MNLKGRKRYNQEQISVNIYGNNIEKVKSYKYLGITIDEKLKWKEQIKRVTHKMQKYIPIFYNIKNFTQQKVCIQLYKTLVLSNINYGIEIYGNSDLIKLQKVADKILGIICNCSDKDKIRKIKIENKILNIENYNKTAWIKLSHDIIYNSKNLPIYFRNLIEIKQNRNGIIINTNYRRSVYGDKISYNVMEQIWNKIDLKIRNTQDKLLFHDSLQKYFNEM